MATSSEVADGPPPNIKISENEVKHCKKTTPHSKGSVSFINGHSISLKNLIPVILNCFAFFK